VGGWGAPPPPPGQQPWGPQDNQQGGWQQQGQQPWQAGPGGPGGPKKGGIPKDKLPMVIGGGLIGLVLIALVVFLGVKALGGDDKTSAPDPQPTTSQPTGDPTGQPTGDPTGQPTGEPTGDPNNSGSSLGNATGQAKVSTDKLQGAGFQCSDLFNGPQGAHRGCFKFDEVSQAEVLFQFQADGTIIGVLVRSENRDNVNNAAVSFDAALQAIGNDTFGGADVAKIQTAVKTGQKTAKVGSSWGEFRLLNSGDSVQISGGKSGSDSFDTPRKSFQTTEAQLAAALKAKQYVCSSSCRKELGKSGSQRIFGIGGNTGIRILEISASGDPAEVTAALPVAIGDAMDAVKGPDAAAIKTFLEAHKDGKPYAAYVAGWRIQQTGSADDDYSSQTISIKYESYYV
jgi:PT repeat-containing protein